MDPINDATITPEQAQNIQGGEGESPVAKVEETKPEPKVETPAEPEVKKEDNSETPEEPKEDLTPKRSIYADLKEKKAEVREAKEEIARLSQELETLKQAKANADTPAEKNAVEDDIVAFAESIGADPEAIEALVPLLEKRIKAKDSDISKEDIEFLKKVKAEQALSAEKEAFINEFDGFVPTLKTEFPYVSDAELVAIRKEVERLAHTPKYHDKEVDYIYFKERGTLSQLISPKRDSIEGSGTFRNEGAAPAPVEFSSKSSPADIQKSMNSDSRGSNLEIRSSN